MKSALLAVAWNSDSWTFEALESHYKTLVRYLNLKDMGMVLGYGCGTPSMTQHSEFPQQAYLPVSYTHLSSDESRGYSGRSARLRWDLSLIHIFSTYYFQALIKPKIAFAVSVARGLVISGILIFLLPAAAGADAIWFAMPITEAVTAGYVVFEVVKYTKRLNTERSSVT